MKSVLTIIFCLIWITVLTKATLPKAASFGCFDDCFNYTAGYLLTKGKILYSEIFFNHAPIPAYISGGIIHIFKPAHIFELLQIHRKMLFVWTCIWICILLLRFKNHIAIPLLLFETGKWYFFGFRFLGESIIVYPLAYLFLIQTLHNKKHTFVESLWIGILAYFVIFTREPYALLALFLVCLYSYRYKQFLSFAVLFFLTSVSFLYINPADFIFSVVTVNTQTILSDAHRQTPIIARLIQMIFYPVTIILSQKNSIWNVLTILYMLFAALCVHAIRNKQHVSLICITYVSLILANIRLTPAGAVYYQAFQLLPWFMISVVSIQSLIHIKRISYINKQPDRIKKHNSWMYNKKNIHLAVIQRIKFHDAAAILVIFLLIYVAIHPKSYIWEKALPHEDVQIHYHEELIMGTILHKLSKKEQDIFIDGWAELLYWQAQRISNFPYVWYTSIMPYIPKYYTARINYLLHTPPEFYYGNCPGEKNPTRLFPGDISLTYVNVYVYDKPSCIWIRNNILDSISPNQWNSVKEFSVSVPF